jgi:hypothetical protein
MRFWENSGPPSSLASLGVGFSLRRIKGKAPALRCCLNWDLFDLIDLYDGVAWRRRTAVRLYGQCRILRCRTLYPSVGAYCIRPKPVIAQRRQAFTPCKGRVSQPRATPWVSRHCGIAPSSHPVPSLTGRGQGVVGRFYQHVVPNGTKAQRNARTDAIHLYERKNIWYHIIWYRP